MLSFKYNSVQKKKLKIWAVLIFKKKKNFFFKDGGNRECWHPLNMKAISYKHIWKTEDNFDVEAKVQVTMPCHKKTT